MDFDLKEVTEDPETEALLEAVSTTGGCRLLNVFVLGSDLVLTSTFDETQMYVLIKCRPGTQFYVLPQGSNIQTTKEDIHSFVFNV